MAKDPTSSKGSSSTKKTRISTLKSTKPPSKSTKSTAPSSKPKPIGAPPTKQATKTAPKKSHLSEEFVVDSDDEEETPTAKKINEKAEGAKKAVTLKIPLAEKRKELETAKKTISDGTSGLNGSVNFSTSKPAKPRSEPKTKAPSIPTTKSPEILASNAENSGSDAEEEVEDKDDEETRDIIKEPIASSTSKLNGTEAATTNGASTETESESESSSSSESEDETPATSQKSVPEVTNGKKDLSGTERTSESDSESVSASESGSEEETPTASNTPSKAAVNTQ
jgi:hypothetical protein